MARKCFSCHNEPTKKNKNSHPEIVLHGFSSPEKGSLLTDYAALIEAHALIKVNEENNTMSGEKRCLKAYF